MSEDDPSKKTESPRRDILKTIGAGAFGLGIGAPMLSNGAAAASQDSSNVVENFSHSEVTGADAENSIQDLTDTEEYSLLEESVKSDGMSVDTSNAVVYRSSYEENQRTVASFPVDGDDELRVVIGKNDNTGDIVIAATERKTRTNNQSEIVLKQPQSIAQQSDSPTVSSGVTEADSLSSSGLVTTTVTVPHGTEQSTISTGTQSTVVTPQATVWCWACRIDAGLACDVGCQAGTAFICGLAGAVTSVIGAAACISIAESVCLVISAAGCGLNADEICCRAGGWCC